MAWLSTLWAIVARYATPLKLVSLALSIVSVGYFAWDGYTTYTKLVQDVQTQKETIKKQQERIDEYRKIAGHNIEMLRKKEVAHAKELSILKELHSTQLENARAYTSISERTRHEEDGPIAPVLRATLERLRLQSTTDTRTGKNRGNE